ncbi:MAG: hypothetical protein M3R15_06275 [Acidobacteriota bacterium]|nr:hypothetical protein [Acidobacteriota bacterium]
MRSLPAAAVLLLLSSFFTLITLGQQPPPAKRPLRLTAQILGQQYCAVSEETDALRLRLRLQYANVGDEKLILYRGKNLFYQTSVSRRAADAAIRRHEAFMSSAWYFDDLPEKIEQPAPGRAFVILPPGAFYETEQTVAMSVMHQRTEGVTGAIAAGEHVLQVTVSTWYESKALAQKLRERWMRSGYLWFDQVSSAPINFSFTEQRSAPGCR